MNAVQFIHIEAYGRQAGHNKAGGHTLFSILDEAARVPAACPHITSPQSPNVIYGQQPSKIADLAVAWATTVHDPRGRRLRIDAPCLLAGVVSLPNNRSKDWPAYRSASLAWLTEYYGVRLVSALEHLDEAHPHIHFYCVPLHGERFDVLHPGRRASAVAAHEGKIKGQQNRAYKVSMRNFQDQFYQRVALQFGLTRTGPRRTRLPRQIWKQQQSLLGVYDLARRALELQPESLILPPAPISLAEIDMSKVAQIIRSAQRNAIGEESFTHRQLVEAAHAGIAAGINAARKDDERRWNPLLNLVQGVRLINEQNKALAWQVNEILQLFTEEEIRHRLRQKNQHHQSNDNTSLATPSPS